MTKFHFDRTYDSKEISISVTCIAYDDVKNLEICGSYKNTKISISRERNIIFPSNKKLH